jgi:hypothetical protein
MLTTSSDTAQLAMDMSVLIVSKWLASFFKLLFAQNVAPNWESTNPGSECPQERAIED